MNALKTKSLESIEQKMQGLDESSLRYQVLKSAKNFKTSWVELGQSLFSVWKDKLYKDWGYANFDTYTLREIGIRKETAMKLLRSYYFLEKEEPQFLKEDYSDGQKIAQLPTYESINALRLAKNKKELDDNDYAAIKKDVFEKGKDVREVRKELTALIRQRQELEPQAAWKKRKESSVRRLVGVMKTLKTEIETAKLLPMTVIKQINSLIEKLESELV